MIVLVATLLLCACKSTAPSADNDEIRDVRAVVQRIIAADNARDLDAALNCYTPDAQWHPPGVDPVAGRAQIRTLYAGMFESWTPEMTVVSENTWVLDDVAVDRGRTSGRLVSRDGRPEHKVDDKYIMMLRREGGAWRITFLAWRAAPGPG
jgi:uncharacterized protein (TIGR02246 family)